MHKHNHDLHTDTEIIYTCPMHPKVRQDKPGLCPDCGMNLVPIKSKAGEGHQHSHESETFDKHAGHSTNIFKTKFWISLALSVPVVAYSDIVQKLLDWQAPVFTGSQYVPAILGSIIFFYGGWIFLASAYRELRAKLPGMMTLISLAILTAYIYSVYVVLTGGEHTLFWELSTLIVIMLLGHWVEMRAVTGAQGALKELSKLLPDTAEVIRDGKSIIIPLDEVVVGDIVLVKPGGKIPIDGEVIDGSSDVDESLATGESKPVAKLKGAEVIAGTVNGDGSLKIIVTKIGEHTFLAGVARLVAEAQASKSRLQLLSDRAAFYLTIVAVVTGGVTLASWLAASTGTAFAVERMVAVLVIACPHALGLAIPLVSSISTTKAARNGFLVKQRQALESARNIDTVLFDKTGTLTRGEYGVVGLWSNGITDIELLQFAASVNSGSEHVVAKAMLNRAQVQNVKLLPVSNFLRVPGKGVEAQVNGQLVRVGGEAMLEGGGINLPEKIQSDIVTAGKAGHTIIYVLRNKELLGVMALADVIREESRQAVADLKAMGIKVGMITGDSDEVAKWVAQELKITEYFAKVLPNQKTDKVKLLQANSVKVAMVGDGINDAPALTQADLGIAIGAGTNVAIESAGIILVKNDPRDIVKILRLSRLTHSKMIQNLFWATGYNVVALPLAAGILFNQGIILQPAVAALFMSLSTVIVAVNAWLLNKKKLG